MNLDTIESIQRAGTALHSAQALLAEEAARQSQRVNASIEGDPFNVSADSEFEYWKGIARMSQSVAMMEEQLKKIYFAAVNLHAGKGFGQVPALSLTPRTDSQVIDAQAPTNGNASRPARVKRSQPKAMPLPTPVGVGTIKGGASKAFGFLKTKLLSERFTRVTFAEIGESAKMPQGSISFAIHSLKSKGLIEEGEKGHYRLS